MCLLAEGQTGLLRCQLNVSIVSNSDYSDFVQFFNAQNVAQQILAQVNCEIECEQDSGPNDVWRAGQLGKC